MQRDRDLGQPMPRNQRRAGFVATSALSVMAFGATIASACGGGDGKTGKTPEVAGTLGATNTPRAEVTIRPTEIPTAVIPTATAEAKPLTKDELAAEIDKAYAGREFDQNGVATDTRTAAGLKGLLAICADPAPTNVRIAITSCAILGAATKQLNTLTGDKQFWTLNQLLKTFFDATVDTLEPKLPKDQPLAPGYKTAVIAKNFTK